MGQQAGEVLSDDAFRDLYGKFFARNTPLVLNRSIIPETLWPLLPYAAFWGITDDLKREQLVRGAPPELIDNLKAVVRSFESDLDDWLAGEEADRSPPSPEYVAFSALRMAADFA